MFLSNRIQLDTMEPGRDRDDPTRCSVLCIHEHKVVQVLPFFLSLSFSLCALLLLISQLSLHSLYVCSWLLFKSIRDGHSTQKNLLLLCLLLVRSIQMQKTTLGKETITEGSFVCPSPHRHWTTDGLYPWEETAGAVSSMMECIIMTPRNELTTKMERGRRRKLFCYSSIEWNNEGMFSIRRGQEGRRSNWFPLTLLWEAIYIEREHYVWSLAPKSHSSWWTLCGVNDHLE